jgi:hypothetical protein
LFVDLGDVNKSTAKTKRRQLGRRKPASDSDIAPTVWVARKERRKDTEQVSVLRKTWFKRKSE